MYSRLRGNEVEELPLADPIAEDVASSTDPETNYWDVLLKNIPISHQT